MHPSPQSVFSLVSPRPTETPHLPIPPPPPHLQSYSSPLPHLHSHSSTFPLTFIPIPSPPHQPWLVGEAFILTILYPSL